MEPWWVHDAAAEVRGVRGWFTVRGVGADGGAFLLIIVWALRLVQCFVYRLAPGTW